MEKRYFVLKKGYLNIDEDFFYFSDHGNWEACQILEETEVPRLTFFYVSNYIIQVTYTVLAIIFVMCLFSEKFEISFVMLFMMVIFHFVNLRYNIKYFKIPLREIQQLILREEKLIVKFINTKATLIEHTVKLDDSKEVKDIQEYLREHFNQKLSIA